MGDLNPVAWDTVTDIMEEKLIEIDFHAEDVLLDWRTPARASRIDRELFEEYGMFKDYILDPRVQGFLELVDTNVNLDLMVEPHIGIQTALLVLMILRSRVASKTGFAFLSAFVFNLNPIYVILCAAGWYVLGHCNRYPRGYQVAKPRAVQTTEPRSMRGEHVLASDFDKDFDHVLVAAAADLSTLYAASLLAKVGHSCCVLIPEGLDDSLVAFTPSAPFAVPVCNVTTGGAVRYQELFDVVQSKSSAAADDRVLFVPVGDAADGYVHTIVASVQTKTALGTASCYALRTGESALVGDLARKASLRREEVGAFVKALEDLKGKQAPYLYSKLDTNRPRAALGAVAAAVADSSSSSSNSGKVSNTPAESFRDHCMAPFHEWPGRNPLTSQLWTRVQSLGPVLGAVAIAVTGEAVPVHEMSASAVTTMFTAADTGVHYPVGGLLALRRALIRTIREAGGEVYCDVPVLGIAASKDEASGTSTASGVRVRGDGSSEAVFSAGTSVISGAGAICTYTKLVDPEHVSTHVRSCLDNSIREAEPYVKVVFWCDGDGEALGLTGCDYAEVPHLGNGGAAGQWTSHPTQADMNEQFVRVWSPSAKDPAWEHEGQSAVVVEMQLGSGVLDMVHHAWPSTGTEYDTPTRTAASDSHSPVRVRGPKGPRVFVTSATEESPARRNVCGGSIALSSGQRTRLTARARAALVRAYPRAAAAVSHEAVAPPVIGGHRIANLTSKFAADLDVASDVKCLFLCGRDVGLSGLAADVQGGWLAANAVLGYDLKDSAFDLSDETRDITRDIRSI